MYYIKFIYQQHLKKSIVGSLFTITIIYFFCFFRKKQKQQKQEDQNKDQYQQVNQDEEVQNEPQVQNQDDQEIFVQQKEENQIEKSQTENSEYFEKSAKSQNIQEKISRNQSQKEQLYQEAPQNQDENKQDFFISEMNQNQSTQFQKQSVSNEEQINTEKGNEQQFVVSEDFQEDQQISNLIIKLYSLSCNSRDIPEEYKNFLGLTGDSQELINHYGGQNQMLSEKILKELQGFRRIRGDGNCFYTAFIVQYISLVLNYEQDQFERFIEDLEKMNFEMNYINNFEIPVNQRNQMAKEFSNQLKRLKMQNDPTKKFEEQITDTQNILYGLAIIFLRNLTKEFYAKDEEIKFYTEDDLTPDFLEWEQECNSNEVVLLLLSKQLNINVVVYFIDSQNNQFDIRSYGEEHIPKIHLIMAPGHYQIAIPHKIKIEEIGIQNQENPEIIELAASGSQKEYYDSSKNFEIMDKSNKGGDNSKQLEQVEEQQFES